MHPGWTSPEHVITTLHPASMYSNSVMMSGCSRSVFHRVLMCSPNLGSHDLMYMRLCMHLILYTRDYMHLWWPYIHETMYVFQVDFPKYRLCTDHLSSYWRWPGSALQLSGALCLSCHHERCSWSEAWEPRCPPSLPFLSGCQCRSRSTTWSNVLTCDKHTCPAISQDSIPTTVGLESCQGLLPRLQRFLHGMRSELFFLGWKGTCNSSISYYTILTQWKKITTPQKLQTCVYVCVLGALTLDDTRSHMPRAPVVTVFYWCTLCVTKKERMHTQRTVFLRDADLAQLYRLILW